MEQMRSMMIITVAAVALIAVGCSQADLETELATTKAEMASLDSTLTATQAELNTSMARNDSLQQSLHLVENELDSVTESYESAAARANRLTAKLQEARTQYQATVDSLEAVTLTQETELDRWKTELENVKMRVTATERQKNDLIRTRDSLYAFIDDVQPWYDYYKNEARRNWLKKLFGAGDAEKPETTEPTFMPTETPEDLEAMRP